MYTKDYYCESILFDPFWESFYYKYYELKETWTTNYLYTTPKYSLLICTHEILSAHNQNLKHKQKWIATVSILDDKLRVTEIVLILEIFLTGFELTILCPFCDPCDSFKMVSLDFKLLPTSKHEL